MIKMQLDVEVSPPANIITFRLDLTHLPFDFDPRDRCPGQISWPYKQFHGPTSDTFQDMNYCPVILVQ